MKITRRSPRIKIGNTTYIFGKNGISTSTKIAKGVRLRQSASGKSSIGGSFLGWRWSQDLDELGQNKSSQDVQQLREQRKNELSLWLLIFRPFVFFEHLFKRVNQKQNQQIPTQAQQQLPQKNPPTGKPYETNVTIFKKSSNTLVRVTNGVATLENDRIVVKANVTKEIFYRDILDVCIDRGKVFISSKGRSIPLVIEVNNVAEFMQELKVKREGLKQ